MALITKHTFGTKPICGFGLLAVAALFTSGTFAQDRERDHDRDRTPDREGVARLEPGTVVAVRMNEAIDVNKGDNRVYTGVVDQDIRGENDRLLIPRGSTAEMMVRYSGDNDLNLDFESVMVDGRRYAVRAEEKRIESRRDNSLVGSIVGAISGGEARGIAVRVPRDTVVTFRLARPLEVGVPDRGITRDGHHYHDYYGDRDGR
jgi:hypothetical protein